VWIIQDRIDDLENAKMHDRKKIQIFLLHKRHKLFGGDKVSCAGKDIVPLIQV